MPARSRPRLHASSYSLARGHTLAHDHALALQAAQYYAERTMPLILHALPMLGIWSSPFRIRFGGRHG